MSDNDLLLQGCQDCCTVSATFKLLEGFEGILERPVIAQELHVNHLRLLSAYAADLGAVRLKFPMWHRPSQSSDEANDWYKLMEHFIKSLYA